MSEGIQTRAERWGKSWGKVLWLADKGSASELITDLDDDEISQVYAYLDRWRKSLDLEVQRRR